MTLDSKLKNLVSWSLLKMWLATTKAQEKALGAKVKSKITGSGDQRKLVVICKAKREVLWQVEASGSYLDLAGAVTEVEDKGERPSAEWYKAHTP